MSATPNPPRPPVPPQPPRSGSHIVAIALLVLLLIVIVSAITLWTGLRMLSRTVQVRVDEGAGGKKEVSIKTPVGSLEVGQGVDEARLGLPIYPGARRLKEEGATVNLDLPGETNVRVVVGKFETPDPLEKVRDFYKQRLGDEVTKYRDRGPDGKTVFEIKHTGREKVVALVSTPSGTRIELVQVIEAKETTN